MTGADQLWNTWVGNQSPSEFLANCENGGTIEEFSDYVERAAGENHDITSDLTATARALHAHAGGK